MSDIDHTADRGGGEPPVRGPAMAFSAAGFRRGVRAVLPLTPGSLLFGLSLGLLAEANGLGVWEIAAMSLTVFAGASQYLAVELWQDPPPFLTIVLATLLINSRHVLMSATLASWLRGRPKRQVLGALFFLVDETWGMTVAKRRQGETDLAFLPGAGLVLYVCWNSGTVIGHLAAGLIEDPARWGLDAFGMAMFLVLLLLQWQGRWSLLPWIVAGAVAVAAEALLPGAWYVLLGAVAGSLAGGLRGAPRP